MRGFSHGIYYGYVLFYIKLNIAKNPLQFLPSAILSSLGDFKIVATTRDSIFPLPFLIRSGPWPHRWLDSIPVPASLGFHLRFTVQFFFFWSQCDSWSQSVLSQGGRYVCTYLLSDLSIFSSHCARYNLYARPAAFVGSSDYLAAFLSIYLSICVCVSMWVDVLVSIYATTVAPKSTVGT